jgi:hypothetical protein
MYFFLPDFISYVDEDKTPDSPYQSVVPNIETFKRENPTHRKDAQRGYYLRFIEGILALDFSVVFIAGRPTGIKMYLDYHYKKYVKKYPGEGIDFLYFVNNWMSQPNSGTNVLPSNAKYINEWIEEKREELQAEVKELQMSQTQNQKKPPRPQMPDEFSEWFKLKEHYDYILKLLTDKSFLSRSTGEWRDDKKDKAFAISILKYLKEQGYFRLELKPTAEDYRRITNDVWGMDVKPSTARQAKISKANLKFIPPANQIT